MGEGGKACSGCHEMPYCSAECQKSDWRIHKLVCKSLKAFSDSDRPHQEDMEYRRAIYFPENEDRPRFIWIRIKPDIDGSAIVDASSLPPGSERLREIQTFKCNIMLRRELQRYIRVLADFSAGESGSSTLGAENKSMAVIDPELKHDSRGPFVALGVKEASDWKDQTFDMGTVDFRNMVDGMRYLYWVNHHYRDGNDAEDCVKGIMLNCIGDRIADVGNPCPAWEIEIPRSMCNTTTEVTIELADRVGMPLVVKKIAPSLPWRDKETITGMPNLHNASAASLSGIALDPAISINTPLSQLQLTAVNMAKLGTWKIVRKDGKPLTVTLLDGLLHYIGHKIEHLSDAVLLSPNRREIVFALATKEEFDNWYAANVNSHTGGVFNT
jgi:hypothetical protein